MQESSRASSSYLQQEKARCGMLRQANGGLKSELARINHQIRIAKQQKAREM